MAECTRYCNVIAAFIAATLSLVALICALSSKGGTETALALTGDGANMAETVSQTVLHLVTSFLLNGFACTCICLSHFHACESLDESTCAREMINALTSSSAFCWMRFLSFAGFLLQVYFTSMMIVAAVIVIPLGYLCFVGGSTVEYHVNWVIQEMANITVTGKDPLDTFGTGNYTELKDTPLVSAHQVLQHLPSFPDFCLQSEKLGGTLVYFVVSSMLSLVSLALMAVALNGERARTAVHEAFQESMPKKQGDDVEIQAPFWTEVEKPPPMDPKKFARLPFPQPQR
eukprot:TRINITY_DN25343_c0_g1_i2.p1 TRINITY_DN25343_c0_g1~~TRINITY_DN25343_c0_g1_i2.p1  ORF type:complete len:287 (+),score=37.10 TRINITY_DN25343_c0_g1_i2:133-993(+)